MNKPITKFLAVLILVSAAAGPACAKSNEYNFNTCKYNFYNNVDPFSRQPTTAPNIVLNQGIGQSNAATENLKNSINVSVYSQTPQRTITLQNRPVQTRTMRPNYYQQQQQPTGYYYVPGQNGNAANYSETNVTYQINGSGAATYSTGSGAVNNNGSNQQQQQQVNSTNNSRQR
jgi:hypothetical protein